MDKHGRYLALELSVLVLHAWLVSHILSKKSDVSIKNGTFGLTNRLQLKRPRIKGGGILCTNDCTHEVKYPKNLQILGEEGRKARHSQGQDAQRKARLERFDRRRF
jgi:hypothetical protein